MNRLLTTLCIAGLGMMLMASGCDSNSTAPSAPSAPSAGVDASTAPEAKPSLPPGAKSSKKAVAPPGQASVKD